MHPALSVIFFTTASGAGYGLLTILGICYFFQISTTNFAFGLSAIGIAVILITTGLLSSTFHLGHPERAWRALSQWRSSWLSREGILAIVTYVSIIVLTTGWLFLKSESNIYVIAALTMSMLCLLTVYATSMIYASLKTIHAWCNHWVPLVYLSIAIMTGMLLLNALLLVFSKPVSVITYSSLLSILIAFVIKLAYWRFIRNTHSASTAETATGLGGLGKVKMLHSPHSQDNYLLKELGFEIARKHSYKLRRICAMCSFIIPFLLTLVVLTVNAPWPVASSIFAVIFALFGVVVERWLFFAEAKHTVMLYYGKTNA
jgi:sulfite dehydrogenase (quinone) subunit SoeC